MWFKFLLIFNFMIFTDFNFNFFNFLIFIFILFLAWGNNCRLFGKGITTWEKKEGWKRVLARFTDYFWNGKVPQAICIFIWENIRSIDSFGNKWIRDHIKEHFESPPKRQSCHEKGRHFVYHNRYQHKSAIKENERIDMGGHQRVSRKRPRSRFFFFFFFLEREHANWGITVITKVLSMHLWKVEGALHKPNGILLYA